MSLITSNTATASVEQEVLPADNYPARISQVLDLGLQEQRPYEGVAKRPANEIMVTYELVSEFLKDEDGADRLDKPRWVSETFCLFGLHSERAKSTIRYNALDPRHINDGDWSKMIGTPCILAVVNNKSKSNGRTYANVGGVTGPMKGMIIPNLVNDTKVFTLDDPDMGVFNALPEWIQTKILGNLDIEGSPLQNALGITPVADPKAEAEKAIPSQDDAAAEIDSDDIPF